MTRKTEDKRKVGEKGVTAKKNASAGSWPLAVLELVLGLACPALGWAYLRVVSSAGGSFFSTEGPVYELLLVAWLACALVGSILGLVKRDQMRGNVVWRIGRVVCVAFLALFVAMLAVLAVFMVAFTKTKA